MLFFIELKSSWIDIFASLLRKALIILFQQKPFYQKKKKKRRKNWLNKKEENETHSEKKKNSETHFLIRQGRIVEIVTLHSLLGTLLEIANQSSQPGHLLLRFFN